MIHKLTEFIFKFLLPFAGLPLIGVVIAAWLTNSFFPFRLKRREWRWEKEIWAREMLFESVSRVSFLADHYFKGEHQDRFSMSGLNLGEVDDEIVTLVRNLHKVGHKIKLYLDKHNVEVFESYLKESQEEYDAAKETWGQWDADDHMSELAHTEGTISAQGQVAESALKQFRLSS